MFQILNESVLLGLRLRSHRSGDDSDVSWRIVDIAAPEDEGQAQILLASEPRRERLAWVGLRDAARWYHIPVDRFGRRGLPLGKYLDQSCADLRRDWPSQSWRTTCLSFCSRLLPPLRNWAPRFDREKAILEILIAGSDDGLALRVREQRWLEHARNWLRLQTALDTFPCDTSARDFFQGLREQLEADAALWSRRGPQTGFRERLRRWAASVARRACRLAWNPWSVTGRARPDGFLAELNRARAEATLALVGAKGDVSLWSYLEQALHNHWSRFLSETPWLASLGGPVDSSQLQVNANLTRRGDAALPVPKRVAANVRLRAAEGAVEVRFPLVACWEPHADPRECECCLSVSWQQESQCPNAVSRKARRQVLPFLDDIKWALDQSALSPPGREPLVLDDLKTLQQLLPLTPGGTGEHTIRGLGQYVRRPEDLPRLRQGDAVSVRKHVGRWLKGRIAPSEPPSDAVAQSARRLPPQRGDDS